MPKKTKGDKEKTEKKTNRNFLMIEIDEDEKVIYVNFAKERGRTLSTFVRQALNFFVNANRMPEEMFEKSAAAGIDVTSISEAIKKAFSSELTMIKDERILLREELQKLESLFASVKAVMESYKQMVEGEIRSFIDERHEEYTRDVRRGK